MKKAKIVHFCGLAANSRSILATLFLTRIVCVTGYFVVKSYADDSNQMTLLSATVNANTISQPTSKRDMKRSETVENDSFDEWQTIRMRVTAYCPCPKCCGSYSDGVTASGHKIRRGDLFVAADKIYPFGTEMIIPGYKSSQAVKVLDRGGVIRGNRLDVFFGSHQKALEWGVRHLNVKIRGK